MIRGECAWKPSKRTYSTSDGIVEEDRQNPSERGGAHAGGFRDDHPSGSQRDDEPLPLTLLGGYIVMVNKPATLVNAPLPVQKQYHRDDLPVAILAAGLVSENDLVF